MSLGDGRQRASAQGSTCPPNPIAAYPMHRMALAVLPEETRRDGASAAQADAGQALLAVGA